MAMAEGAALRILAGEADGRTFKNQAAERQHPDVALLAESPVS